MVPKRIILPEGDVVLYEHVNTGYHPDHVFENLRSGIPWEQRALVFGGKEVKQPRLISWHGDWSYTYSGLRLAPKPWTFLLEDLRDAMTKLTNHRYNGVLLNYYRDGQDSIGFHSDDEPEFGDCPVIASLSFGASRTMTFQHKERLFNSVNVELTNGSVLVMAGQTQSRWKHGIMKTKLHEPAGPRINLTFRNILYPR